MWRCELLKCYEMKHMHHPQFLISVPSNLRLATIQALGEAHLSPPRLFFPLRTTYIRDSFRPRKLSEIDAMANQQATVRYYCYAPLCSYSSKRSDEPSRHWRLEHSDLGQYDRKEILRLTLQEGEQHVQAIREARRRLEEPQLGTELETDLETELPSSDNNMDRPHRTQRPTEKVKPAVTAKRADDPLARPVIPPRYALPEHDPKWFAPPKEVARIYDHTKTSLTTGEEIKFYRLGPQ